MSAQAAAGNGAGHDAAVVTVDGIDFDVTLAVLNQQGIAYTITGEGGDRRLVITAPGASAGLHAYRQALADDAERAVQVIQAKYDGIKESLATAKAEAKRLRVEAEGQ